MSVRIILCAVVLVLASGSAEAQTAAAPPPKPKSNAITLNEAFLRLRIAAIEVEVARSNLEQFQERAAWADRMAKKGFISPSQVTVDRVRAAEAHIAYLKARANLDALLRGAKPKQ
jgi:hypothetical protein